MIRLIPRSVGTFRSAKGSMQLIAGLDISVGCENVNPLVPKNIEDLCIILRCIHAEESGRTLFVVGLCLDLLTCNGK